MDWYPWGTEAFERAVEMDLPILLSVGYSACHWCHVMERESFENDEIAALMNANFVNIKVDREERMDPPIQTEYLRSGGAMILTLIVDGAREMISFCIRSAIPGNMVVPPERTLLAYRSLRMSTSHFMMEL